MKKHIVKALCASAFVLLLTAVFAFSAIAEETTPVIPTDNWVDFVDEVTEKDGVYEIYTPEQLAWVARRTTTGKSDFSGKTVKLMNDIDLSAHLWTPIGTNAMPFKGDFDGQGHTIKGLIITGSSSPYLGLFGYASGGSLANVVLLDTYINISTRDDTWVGCLAGYAASVENCRISTAMVNGKASNNQYTSITIGGLVGNAADSVINCNVNNTTVYGVSSSSSSVGGLVGNAFNVKNCNVSNTTVTGSSANVSGNKMGGLAGSATYVTNCNISSITVSGSNYAGGLVGDASYVANCSVNNATVSGGDYRIGGLVGEASGITNSIVSNTVVTGSYSDYAGGLAGYTDYSDITNCGVSNVELQLLYTTYAGGLCGLQNSTSGAISNSFASVILTSGNQNLKFGGLVGDNKGSISNCYAHVETDLTWYGLVHTNGGLVQNCYYLNTAEKAIKLNDGECEGCPAMSEDDMKADAFVSALNGYFDSFGDWETVYRYWEKGSEENNDSLPVLALPKITSLEIIAPAVKGGSIQFVFRGENFDRIARAAVSAPNSGEAFALADTAVVNDSLITASYTPEESSWQAGETAFSYSGTVYVALDGIGIASYPYTAVIPYYKVTALSYADTLMPSGRQVEIVLKGENLAACAEPVTLSATSAAGTVSTTHAVKDGDTYRVILPLPANMGEEDVVYTLSVSLGSTVQKLSGYQLTVKPLKVDTPNNPFDLNSDGIVDVMDLMFLLRYITNLVS